MSKTKDLDIVNERFKEIMDQIEGVRTERVVTSILIAVQSHTMPRVPKDTGTLANSIFRQVHTGPNGYDGAFGFTAAYAAAVHAKKGTLKGTGTPRDPKRPGRGNFWDPEGEPKFLQKGVEDMVEDDLARIIKEEYDLGE